jgi:hypothetical protein
MLLRMDFTNPIAKALLAVSLTLSIGACSSGITPEPNTNESPSTEEVPEVSSEEVTGDQEEASEKPKDEPKEIKPPSEDQFEQNLKALQFQYDAALGADIYFPQAGGRLPDGVGIGLQLVFVDYDEYFVQLRVVKQPTGDFDIQSLEIDSGGEQIEFSFSGSQLYDAYIYDELTFEIGEYRLDSEEIDFFFSLLESDEPTWNLTGASETLESSFDKLSLLGIGTVLRFKQGLDEGYEIPEGLAQPLM